MEDRVARLEESVERVAGALERLASAVAEIEKHTKVNSEVAAKYGNKADSLFGVVDAVSRAMNRVFFFRLGGSSDEHRNDQGPRLIGDDAEPSQM